MRANYYRDLNLLMNFFYIVPCLEKVGLVKVGKGLKVIYNDEYSDLFLA